MFKRDHNLVNAPPLKKRRRELRNEPTSAEILLWAHLKGRQVLGKKFRRQYSIGKYVIDFFCVECDIGIELDGSLHFAELKVDYERQRTEFLESQGVRLLRFENKVVFDNMEAVLETIRRAIQGID